MIGDKLVVEEADTVGNGLELIVGVAAAVVETVTEVEAVTDTDTDTDAKTVTVTVPVPVTVAVTEGVGKSLEVEEVDGRVDSDVAIVTVDDTDDEGDIVSDALSLGGMVVEMVAVAVGETMDDVGGTLTLALAVALALAELVAVVESVLDAVSVSVAVSVSKEDVDDVEEEGLAVEVCVTLIVKLEEVELESEGDEVGIKELLGETADDVVMEEDKVGVGVNVIDSEPLSLTVAVIVVVIVTVAVTDVVLDGD
jgi:hypothetical protein